MAFVSPSSYFVYYFREELGFVSGLSGIRIRSANNQPLSYAVDALLNAHTTDTEKMAIFQCLFWFWETMSPNTVPASEDTPELLQIFDVANEMAAIFPWHVKEMELDDLCYYGLGLLDEDESEESMLARAQTLLGEGMIMIEIDGDVRGLAEQVSA